MIIIAVSQCLTGDAVRYDGTGKYHPYLCEQLGRDISLLSVCPEAEVEMGIPRPPIHLIEKSGQIHAIEVENPTHDHTQRLTQHLNARKEDLDKVAGYVFKARSPSCGVTSTPIINEKGETRYAAGLFAKQVLSHYPYLPIIEEESLDDEGQRDLFIERIFAYHDYLNNSDSSALDQLINSFTLTMMARGHKPSDNIDVILEAMKQPIPKEGHLNVLNHCIEIISRHSNGTRIADIKTAVAMYQQGKIALVEPLRLIREQVTDLKIDELLNQRYLFPPSIEWQLRFKHHE